MACNESATGVQLNLSGVLSSSQAAHVLESCIHGVRCLQSLDLSDNSEYSSLYYFIKHFLPRWSSDNMTEQDVLGLINGLGKVLLGFSFGNFSVAVTEFGFVPS